MPPRKSDASKAAATGDEGTPAKEPAVREGINVEDLNLPKSIVTRLAKGVLPPNTQIQGNAMLAMTKSATVFVNYLATHANEHAQSQGKKTIVPADVFKALEDLEFPDFRPRLEAELAKFSEVQTDKRNNYRKKVAADKASGKAGSPQPGEGEEAGAGEHDEEGSDGQPAAKKARREPSDGQGDGSGDIRDGDGMGDRDDDEVDDDDTHVDGDETEEEEHEDEPVEPFQVEEDETEHQEANDEALDNGEDSD